MMFIFLFSSYLHWYYNSVMHKGINGQKTLRNMLSGTLNPWM